MPHSRAPGTNRSAGPAAKPSQARQSKVESRYTVGLAPSVANQVKTYAKTADTSVSKAIAALVRLGLEGQEHRKQAFFKKLRENLVDADPKQEDKLVDEFRALILGR